MSPLRPLSGQALLLLLLLLLLGCVPAGGAPTPRVTPTHGPLNGTYAVELGFTPDPLSLSSWSVAVRDGRGRPLDARLRPTGTGFELELVVDAALLAEPPGSVLLELSGGAAPQPVLRRDGRPLARSRQLVIEPTQGLSAGGHAGLRWVDLPAAGQALRLDPAGRLTLALEGVLDPASVGAACCPLVPEARGVRLAAIHPTVAWRVVGGRSWLELEPPAWSGRLWLSTRRLAVRALDGAALEPRVEREVRAD